MSIVTRPSCDKISGAKDSPRNRSIEDEYSNFFSSLSSGFLKGVDESFSMKPLSDSFYSLLGFGLITVLVQHQPRLTLVLPLSSDSIQNSSSESTRPENLFCFGEMYLPLQQQRQSSGQQQRPQQSPRRFY